MAEYVSKEKYNKLVKVVKGMRQEITDLWVAVNDTSQKEYTDESIEKAERAQRSIRRHIKDDH